MPTRSSPAKLKARADDLTAQREALLASQAEAPEIEPMVAHPTVIADYRRQVDRMAKIATEDDEVKAEARPLPARQVNFIEVSARKGRQGVHLLLQGACGDHPELFRTRKGKRRRPEGRRRLNARFGCGSWI